MRCNREGDSNEIDARNSQPEKQDEPRMQTLQGITIERSPEHENAEDSMCSNRDGDSNEIDESNLHS
jgi:hypothetical protein